MKLSVLSFLLVFSVLAGTLHPTASAQEANVKKETITIVGEEDVLLEKQSFEKMEGKTAYDVLVNAIGKENVETESTSAGEMIVGINGVKPSDDESFYWAFYVNGISSPVGAQSYTLQDGDSISFQYIDYMEPSENVVNLKVMNGDEETEYYPSSFFDEPTAFDLVKLLVGAENLEVTYYGNDVFVNAINGVAMEGNSYWAFYINDEAAEVGLNGYKLQNGDKITVKYETWEAEIPEESTELEENQSTPKIDKNTFDRALTLANKYILSNDVAEWQAVALKQAGETLPYSYYKGLRAQVSDAEGVFSNITDYEKLTLGILAAGKDPRDFEGYNLIESIYNGNVTKQGLNGVAYALIALDSADFDVPSSAKWTRENLIDELLEKQNDDDGGWSWMSKSSPSDADSTGMVLTALAPYNDQEEVAKAITAGVRYLTEQYQSSKINNSSTAATVIIALSALGIDSASIDFTKDEMNIVDYLLTFQNKDGGFDWQGGETSDVFSSYIGYQGIVAYQLFLDGKGSLFKLPLPSQKVEAGTFTVTGVSQLFKGENNVYVVSEEANTFVLSKEVLESLPNESQLVLSNGNVRASVPVALLQAHVSSDITFSFGEVSSSLKDKLAAKSDLIDFTMTSNGQEINDFGNYLVTLSFDLGSYNGNWDSLQIYHVDENGQKLQEMPTTVNKDTKEVSAAVGHFSIYGVFEKVIDEVKVPNQEEDLVVNPVENESEPTNEEQASDTVQSDTLTGHSLPNTATSLFNLLAVGGILILIGASSILLMKRRHTS